MVEVKGFPRIIKMSNLPFSIRKDMIKSDKCKPDDLLIVSVTVINSTGKPVHYSFEKIVGDPVSYLLKRSEKYRKECEHLSESLPGDRSDTFGL